MSIRLAGRLAGIGASASVGSVADSYDDVIAQALNGTFKAELIGMQGPWKDVDQVERTLFQASLPSITWYNEERLHHDSPRSTQVGAAHTAQRRWLVPRDFIR